MQANHGDRPRHPHTQGSDISDSLSDDVRELMADRDVLLNATQASHDLHASRLDALEDALVSNEARRAAALVTKNSDWSYMRNRDRVIEIITYHESNVQELDMMLRHKRLEEAA